MSEIVKNPHPRKKVPRIKDEIDYFKHQVEGIRRMLRMRSVLLADDMGLGKILTDSQPVLTPTGWERVDKIAIGDYLVGVDGKPALVINIFPQGPTQIVRMHFNDGTWADTSWDHLWTVQQVQNWSSSRYSGRTQPGLPAGRWETMTLRDLVALKLKDAAGNRSWRIPTVAPVQFNRHDDLPIDPYTLGMYLAEGSNSSLSLNIQDAPSICDRIGIPWRSISGKPGSAKAYIPKIRSQLRTLNLWGKRSWEKFVPERYLFASIADRLAILQGLMDGDGSSVTPNVNEYSTTSLELLQGVVHLVQSLGGVCRVNKPRITHYTWNNEVRDGRLSYRVNIKLPVDMCPFSTPRKVATFVAPTKYPPTRLVDRVEEVGVETARCFAVDSPSNLFVMDQFVVTHNCIQALTVAACALEAECRKVLIVTPASLKGNWEEEIANYGHNFTCQVLEGDPKQREKVLANFSDDVLIVNYEQVIAHVDQLNMMGFDITIYDEGHFLKNRRSKRTKACLRLNQTRHFVLTGSPILNQIDDLWVLMYRVAPTEFPNYYAFVNRYAVYGGWQNKQIVGIKNEKELRERMAPYLIRREKTELGLVGKLPIIRELLEMHPEQRKLYDQVVEDLELPNPDDAANPMKIENALVRLLRLKEICATPATLGYTDNSTKLDRAVELAEQFVGKGKSVVVFTQFRQVQVCYAERLKAKGISFHMLHGDVKPADRQPLVNLWSEETKAGKPSILICMWQVGGIGMNFVAASTCIALDKLFVPKLNDQGYDRLDRIGQTEPVQIIELLMRKSIEQRIESILKRKQGIFGTMFDIDNSSWKKKLIEAVKDDLL